MTDQEQYVPHVPPVYVGEQVQIGTGFGGMKPVAQSGKVYLVGGELVLVGTKGQLLDRAPVSQVSWKKTWYTMNSVLFVTMGERRYSLGIKTGGLMLLTGAARLVAGNSAAKGFVEALAQEQARAGVGPTG
ncbi:hypothetical protein ABH931_007042 [Streptacidiphilus sp. MAP12-33]|uniref:hypothetical protein n=1 Tax=Streptacidiphilus sp. MAP12-33 TaxID=3156266 RepID=UPI003518BE3D